VLKIAFLVSGNGSIFEHIAIQCRARLLNARIVRLISSSSTAFALERAKSFDIECRVIDAKTLPNEPERAQALAAEFAACQPDLVCLAGYLKKIPAEIVRQYAGRMINIHPALLPAFGGAGMYGRRVHEAVLEYGAKISGATVHLVDDDYDHGPIIAQRAVYVQPDDTPEQLAARIHQSEFDLYFRVVSWFADRRIQINGRHVTILPPPQHP
jgi:phosphoribosylglycinamide formyltransferase-1